MTLTKEQIEYLEKAPNWEDEQIKHLQDPEYQRGWLELTLSEFLEDGNIETFIRCLTYVVKARVKSSGRGEISRLARELNIDRSNLSEIVNIVTEDLIPIIDEKIESEIVDYSFNNIKFENLTIQSDECFDSSQIEQSINDYIEAQNRNSGDNILNEEYSIHDIFSQKYIFD